MAGRTKEPRKGNPDFGTKFKGGKGREARKPVLHQNEEDAVVLARIACKKLGEDNPLVRSSLATLIAVSRGDKGYTGRHIGTRLRAVIEVLDRVVGTPKQAPGGNTGAGVPTWKFGSAPTVGPGDVAMPRRDDDD